ncbi:PTTG1 regulator of sister chromatid separation, securin [Esox lucius]|uniref:Securin n=1 Tax=Esox lucius TaxID=8010 RepID=C1BYL9_ESOLU|nr:securin [Esox lucius]ACO14122.1 Securin [Esox lucius]
MASINFSERENATLLTPALKMRQRLTSAQGNFLKTPLTGKKLNAPRQSGRKALGAVNKLSSAPAVNGKEKNKLLETQDTKVKTLPTKAEEYPDIEKFIPYDPLEFEKYVFPEDAVCLSDLALPGLVHLPRVHCFPEEDSDVFLSYMPMSPLKDLQHSDLDNKEYDPFLQTISEMTIEMPPVMDE